MKNRIKVKSLFISDCHLGSKYCKSNDLLEVLKRYDPENLFLVGDIIDGWKMSKKIYWINDYSYIIRRIIGMIKNGTKVFYISGNHDEFLRKFIPNDFGNIQLLDEYIYTSLKNKKLLIIHGDIFDVYTMNYKFIYWIGDRAYSFAMYVNWIYNKIRNLFGFKYWSLSQKLKKLTKKAVNFINGFENIMVNYAKNKNCDGIICGHIHHPEIKNLEGIEYFNCGDWVESCTLIIEKLDGEIELIHFH
jgi:UDP-2,3-diacylglucosamine pyrophosphatase LpxH